MRPFLRTAPLLAFMSASLLHAQQLTVGPLTDLQPDWLNGAALSPNGRFIVSDSYDDAIGLRRYDRTTKQWASLGKTIMGGQVHWSPNGRFLSYVRKDEKGKNFVWVVPMDTATGLPSGPERRVSLRHGVGAVWSLDSRQLAFANRASGRFSLVVVPFNGGTERVVTSIEGQGQGPLWSPDGRYLYATMVPTGAVNRLVRVPIAGGHPDSLVARPGG